MFGFIVPDELLIIFVNYLLIEHNNPLRRGILKQNCRQPDGEGK